MCFAATIQIRIARMGTAEVPDGVVLSGLFANWELCLFFKLCLVADGSAHYTEHVAYFHNTLGGSTGDRFTRVWNGSKLWCDFFYGERICCSRPLLRTDGSTTQQVRLSGILLPKGCAGS